MKVITLLNHKGGVGKTTLTYTIGAGLASRGYRAVMLDADGQGSLTVATRTKPAPGFYTLVIRPDSRFDELLVDIPRKQYAPIGVPENGGFLWLVPGNFETMGIDNLMGINAVRNRVRELANDVDVVIIDTPPTPSKLHVGVYVATDYILYPTELSLLASNSLNQTSQYTEQAQSYRYDNGIQKIDLMGIVPTMTRLHTRAHKHVDGKLRGKYGELVWDCVPERSAWEDAALEFQPVIACKSTANSPAAYDAWGIIDRVEAKLKENPNEQRA